MGFSCPICSESLERLPAESAQKLGGQSIPMGLEGYNISAAPCGHIFHTYCINKWSHGTILSSKQCPCCRKDIPGLRCLPLFPTAYEESILDDSLSSPSRPGPSCNHGVELSTLRSKVKSMEEELKDVKQLYDMQSEDFTKINAKYQTERVQSEHWMIKSKQYESFKDIASVTEKERKNLERKLMEYQRIDDAVKGNLEDVESEIEVFPPTFDSIRSLLNMKLAVTQELKRCGKNLEICKKERESLRADKMKLSTNMNNLQKKYNELQHIHEVMRNSACEQESSPGPSSRINFSPAADRSRVFAKRSKPVKVDSGDSQQIDSDVDIIKPFHVPVPNGKKQNVAKRSIDSEKSSVQSQLEPAPKFPKFGGLSPIVLSSDTEADSPLPFRVKSSLAGVPPISPLAAPLKTKNKAVAMKLKKRPAKFVNLK